MRLVVSVVLMLVVLAGLFLGRFPSRRFEVRLFELATRLLGHSEQSATVPQELRSGTYGSTLVVIAWLVLEADNVHRRGVQLDDQLVAIERRVDGHLAVRVRGVLLELLGQCGAGQ
jgi:hypothetical protein